MDPEHQPILRIDFTPAEMTTIGHLIGSGRSVGTPKANAGNRPANAKHGLGAHCLDRHDDPSRAKNNGQ
jgi:hypothetical protein